ncbi:EF-hand domain-containing protein [Polaribacter sp. Z022]|uniref:EF-hand domain-containing protein n=1 Tax=Polaribacter sp. Z022 TaxID=2927125 RepID=UPI00202017A5|nr:EF-hand domain-containing protein [Polaribacter sp. Z022]MCL7754993.1 EF-hand domain-containing protein [Polaribacter sp. Z022]
MKNSTKFITAIGLTFLMSNTVFAQEENRDERPKGPPSIKQIFKDLDLNEDGKISLKEAKGPLKQDFKKIDKNEDGFLSKKEIKNAPKPERRERPRN